MGLEVDSVLFPSLSGRIGGCPALISHHIVRGKTGNLEYLVSGIFPTIDWGSYLWLQPTHSWTELQMLEMVKSFEPLSIQYWGLLLRPKFSSKVFKLLSLAIL